MNFKMIRPLILCALFVTVAFAALSTDSVTAQSIQLFLPNIDLAITSPIAEPPPSDLPSDRPAPYDVNAQDVAIQLADTPMGFYMDSSAPIEPSAILLDIGFASGYETLLFNDDNIFVSHFGVGSLVYVFMSPGGAELLHDAAFTVYMDDPDYKQLSVSAVGDEVVAFVSRSTIEGFDFEYYVVVTRQGNVNAIALVGGLAEVTQLSDAVGYARRMLEKATQNGVVATSAGSEDTPLNLETSDSLVLPSVQEWAEKVDMHIAAQLQTP